VSSRVAGNAASDRCTIVTYEPQRVRLTVELSQPSLLVLSDSYYPGWTAEVASDDGPPRPAAILRTNRVMRGVPLPAGKHLVTFTYSPRSLLWGAVLSALAWLSMLGLIVLQRRRSH
jgi:uncharacterized membrane protein YfhO